MENLYAPSFNPCAPCNSVASVSKCYNNNPNWIAVSIPGYSDTILMQKKTVRVICPDEACAAACFSTTQYTPENVVKITGQAIAASLWNVSSVGAKQQTITITTQSGVVIDGVNYTTASAVCSAIEAIVNDCSCNCGASPEPEPEPDPTCNVVIADLAFFDGNWRIILTEDSEAPYLWLYGITGDGVFLVTPTPSFPATLTSTQLFGVVNFAELLEEVPVAISVIGTLQNVSPDVPEDACANGSIGFTVVDAGEWVSGDEFLLPTSLDSCEGGTLTYSVIYQAGVSGATIDTNVLTVTGTEAGQVFVNVYCDGLIAQTYVYSFPNPIIP